MASKSEAKANAPSADTSLDKPAALQSLQDLRGFSANWDGYGAAPPDARILDAIERFVVSLPDDAAPAPKIVPMTRGRVQLEWHRANRTLELEFENPTTIHFLQWDSDRGVEREDIVSVDETAAVRRLLDWFVAE